MTDEPAAIQASFADFRLIKGRKQAQIILEIPIEGADAALAALGGIPQPHSDRWVAVARLNGVTKPEPEPKEKRKWDDLDYCTQAGMRCNERAFWTYLEAKYSPGSPVHDEAEAAGLVRALCCVNSRADLNTIPIAADYWNDLDRSYQAWLRVS